METNNMNSTSQNDDIQSSCLPPQIDFHLSAQCKSDIISISVINVQLND